MRIAAFCIGIVILVGCQKNGPVTVHPVRGQVLHDGKAAAGVRVYFFPTDAPMVPQIPANPHATTHSDGSFSLTTFTDGDGAAEGKYMVILNWPTARKSEHDEEANSDQLFGWYDAAHTKLTAKVIAGDNVIPTFKLDRKGAPPPPSEGIPGRN